MDAAFLSRLVGEEMLSRLDWMTIKPKHIVDMGCGVGEMSRLLQVRFPDAAVLALDVSESMLAFGKQQRLTEHYVCADVNKLPFKNQSVDLLFANFVLSWQPNFQHFLNECKRVLVPDGLLMVNAIGPDTLSEWRGKLLSEHLPCFMDMHDLGDQLLQAGFSDPVVDVNDYTASYQDKHRFFTELRASGFWFPDTAAASQIEGLCQEKKVEWYTEVAFAHAFAPTVSNEVTMSAEGEARIPLAQLRRQLKSTG